MIEGSNRKSELSYFLAQKLDDYMGNAGALRKNLPPYLIEAIEYVTEPLEVVTEAE